MFVVFKKNIKIPIKLTPPLGLTEITNYNMFIKMDFFNWILDKFRISPNLEYSFQIESLMRMLEED